MIDSLRAGCQRLRPGARHGRPCGPDLAAVARRAPGGCGRGAYAALLPEIVFAMRSLEHLIAYGKRIFGLRAGLAAHDRAPVRPADAVRPRLRRAPCRGSGLVPAPAVLTVENLRVAFATRTGPVDAVRGVSLAVGREKLGIVGESGSGKSTVGRAIMGLLPPSGDGHRRPDGVRGHGPAPRHPCPVARPARRPDRHGAAGPEILAQPGDAGRRPDRGEPARPSGPARAGGPRARARAARGRAHPRPATASPPPGRTSCRAAWASA